jgi:hypothetical protein
MMEEMFVKSHIPFKSPGLCLFNIWLGTIHSTCRVLFVWAADIEWGSVIAAASVTGSVISKAMKPCPTLLQTPTGRLVPASSLFRVALETMRIGETLFQRPREMTLARE